ncbi:MAG TPA: TorF family putative porin [Gammaproteobacteria bacterium]|nr:TorF family putative porin [Gammaproteobacteria bacterium]
MKWFISTIIVAIVTAQALNVAAAGEDSPHSFSANVLLATEYQFRGLTQSDEDFAIQGGFDYEYTPLGAYVGFWASSIEFPGLEINSPASVETNLYGGFSGTFSGGINWDIGGLYYYYPDHDENTGFGEYDYFEVYGNLDYTFDGYSLEPSIGIGFDWSPDYFGEDDDGIHIESFIGFSLPQGFGLTANMNYLDVEGDKSFTGGYDYFYYSIELSKSFGILDFAVSWFERGDDCDDILAGGNDDLCEGFVFTVGSSWGG